MCTISLWLNETHPEALLMCFHIGNVLTISIAKLATKSIVQILDSASTCPLSKWEILHTLGFRKSFSELIP